MFLIFHAFGLCALEDVIELSAAVRTHLDAKLMEKMKNCFGVETLIETGSFDGITAAMAALHFKEVHTIEISSKLYRRTKKKLKEHKNAYCYRGDSSKELLPIIQRAKGPLLFWLDAHYSGGDTAQSACGDPIDLEIMQIQKSGRLDSVILIDDIRGHSIPHLIEMMKKIDKNFNSYVIGDILLSFNATYYQPKISSLVLAFTALQSSKDSNALLTAEKSIIDFARSEEAKNIIALSEQYGGVYTFWEGLVRLGQKNQEKAILCFQKSLSPQENERMRQYLQ